MTAIQTNISPLPNTHIVSYWQSGRRAIVAVRAETPAEAIEQAIGIAGPASATASLTTYDVAPL